MAVATGSQSGVRAQPLSEPVVVGEHLTQVVGERRLWHDLTFHLDRGEVLAVLGPNGAGKTTLARLVLGLTKPTDGRVRVNGVGACKAGRHIGYVPQQRAFDRDLPLRGRDLVQFGLDGHRWGVAIRRPHTQRVQAAIEAVGAEGFADRPVGRLSGGEQQRLRVAQALVREPELIVADEPLLSLDLAHQQNVVDLIDAQRRSHGTPVIFITHDINPVLPITDRVLYLSGDGAAIGTVDDVMTTETLSQLYRANVDVLRVRGRLVVVGAPENGGHH